MSARLAVCIPAYDKPQFLRDALTSLCDQDLDRGDYVVIVADDASPSPLAPVVDEFRSRLTLHYHRHDRNVGHLANFDASWQLIDAPFVSFLSHDDVVAPGQLARAMNAAASPGTVLVASMALYQDHPGALNTMLQGHLLRGSRASFTAPYVWEQAEWMALALALTPMSIVGSVFRTEAFRKCRSWLGYPIWHDRLMLAEMGLHGTVVSLPWIGGHYRIGASQLSAELWQPDMTQFRQATAAVLDWCNREQIPVIEFWIGHICGSTAEHRIAYLRMLHTALEREIYETIKRRSEERLGTRLHLGGRMNRLGVPPAVISLVQTLERWVTRQTEK